MYMYIYMHVSAVHYLGWEFRCFNSTIFWCWEEYFECKETCVCVSPALEKLSFEVFYPSLCHIKPYFIFLKSYCWCDTVTATNYKACDDMWRVLRPASYSHFLLRPPFANSSLLGAIEGGQCVGLVNNCQRGKFGPKYFHISSDSDNLSPARPFLNILNIMYITLPLPASVPGFTHGKANEVFG